MNNSTLGNIDFHDEEDICLLSFKLLFNPLFLIVIVCFHKINSIIKKFNKDCFSRLWGRLFRCSSQPNTLSTRYEVSDLHVTDNDIATDGQNEVLAVTTTNSSIEVQCKFLELGCTFKGVESEVKKHEESFALHMDLFLKMNLNQRKDIDALKNDNTKLSNQLHHYRELQNQSLMVVENKNDSNIEELVLHLSEKLRNCEINQQKTRTEIGILQQNLKSMHESVTELMKIQSDIELSGSNMTVVSSMTSDEMKDFRERMDARIIGSYSKLSTLMEQKLHGFEKLQQEQQRKSMDAIQGLSETLKCGKMIGDVALRRVTEQEETLKTSSTRIDQLLAFHRTCHYIWKVDDFSSHQKTNEPLHSETFAIDRYSYQLKLQLYCNGCGKEEGKHLGCYLLAVKGATDQFLKWPVDITCKLTLLSHYQNSCHFGVDFKKRLNRPTGWGFHKFYPLNDLQPEFLVNDILYLKAEVTFDI